jgi:hypothetical protein
VGWANDNRTTTVKVPYTLMLVESRWGCQRIADGELTFTHSANGWEVSGGPLREHAIHRHPSDEKACNV